MLMVFLGRFFEVIIGARPDPLWKLLSKVGLLYALEPVLTVIFVVNLNTVWEKVMSTLSAQIFRRVLIQKVKLKSSNFTSIFFFPFSGGGGFGTAGQCFSLSGSCEVINSENVSFTVLYLIFPFFCNSVSL
jgi:hypothetical protein